MHDARMRFIREHAPGRSFADVGGMWGIDGAWSLLAEELGATSVTLFDGGEPTPVFKDTHRERGSAIRTVQGDLEDPVSVAEVGPHDFVWCTGVVYHTPNPVRQLMNLREITKELLYLGSATIPEIPGLPQACVYYPYLKRSDRAPYARPLESPGMHFAVGTAYDDRPMYGHGNYFFGMTPSALRAMLRTARFEVVGENRHDATPWVTDFVARPLPEHPTLPPVDYYRRRGHGWHEDRPLPFDGYYDKGPDAVATREDMFPRLDGSPPPDPLPPRLRRFRR